MLSKIIRKPLPRLNIVLGPIVNKYREGNLKRGSDSTILKQDLKLVAYKDT